MWEVDLDLELELQTHAFSANDAELCISGVLTLNRYEMRWYGADAGGTQRRYSGDTAETQR